MSDNAGDVGLAPDDTVYRTSFGFNAIYVLESLGAGAPKTGQDVYDLVIYPRTRELDGVYTQFIAIPDETALLRALTLVYESTRDFKHKPIVHLEAHGTETGIELADGTVTQWSALRPQLAAINEASQFNLIVLAVACKGWNLTYSMMPTERAPVALLIGPPSDLSAQSLVDATKRFYGALVEQLDLNQALSAMNEGRPYSAWSIKPATAEILFCRVFRQYVATLADTVNLRERENRLVADLVRAQSLDVLQAAAARVDIRAHMSDQEWWYDVFRERFLMLDRYPANRARCGLTFDLCMPQKDRVHAGGN